MRARWTRLNYLIKHQLYLRILPVVVIAVLAVGLFSGRLLTSRAINTYLEQEFEQQSAQLVDLAARLTTRALAAEARKDEHLHRQALGLERQGPEAVLKDLLALEGVCGAAVVSLDPALPADRLLPLLEPRLDTPENLQRLRAWAGRNKDAYLGLDWMELATRAWGPSGPRWAAVDAYHGLHLFEPLDLHEAVVAVDPLWEGQSGPRPTPVLPVLVQETAKSVYPLTGRDAQGWSRWQILLLMDLDELFGGSPLAGVDDLDMLLDGRGRLLASSVDSLSAGAELAVPGQDFFRGVDGTELALFLRRSAAEGGGHASLGSRLDPYLFTSSSRPELPVLLVSALPYSKVHGGIFLYTAIVVLMATIGLLGCVLAITRVGERLSSRLQALSRNMGEVASGDYTRRLPVEDEDEVGRLAAYFNVMTGGLEEAHTELREKTQRLRVALANMKRLDKAKDDFIALISHEVRTPLTSIMGGIEFLQLVLPQATAEQKRAVEQLRLPEIVGIIESSGIRLRDFMNDAIMMTSLQSSASPVRFEPVPLSDVCEVVLSGLQQERQRLGLTVANELGEAGWNALGDRQLLTTALQKLLRNAVQHNEPGGRVRIAEAAEIPGLGPVSEVVPAEVRRELLHRPELARWRPEDIQWRCVMVYNTGPAIPAEKREALFRKFELVGRIEHHQRGSGLSLSIVQAILENHGGKIYVDSHEGEGNTFYLIGPAVPAGARPRECAAGAALLADAAAPSAEQQRQRRGGVARDEEVDLAAHGAALEVELEHAGV